MTNQHDQAIEEFDKAVEAKVQTGLPRHGAIRAVAIQNPDLHRRYIIAVNRDRPAAIAPLVAMQKNGK